MSTLPGTLHSAHNGTWQVAEHGCQVLAWQADDKPVIWFDAEHADESEAVIRGGIPLCAPWFGHGPNNDQDPQHGLARRTDFEVTVADPFRVVGVAETASIGIRHEVVMTNTALEMTLTLTNHDQKPRVVEGMWHTYLRVADAAQARVRGVRGASWHNFATGDKGSFDANELAVAPDTDTVIQGVGPALASSIQRGDARSTWRQQGVPVPWSGIHAPRRHMPITRQPGMARFRMRRDRGL